MFNPCNMGNTMFRQRHYSFKNEQVKLQKKKTHLRVSVILWFFVRIFSVFRQLNVLWIAIINFSQCKTHFMCNKLQSVCLGLRFTPSWECTMNLWAQNFIKGCNWVCFNARKEAIWMERSSNWMFCDIINVRFGSHLFYVLMFVYIIHCL